MCRGEALLGGRELGRPRFVRRELELASQRREAVDAKLSHGGIIPVPNRGSKPLFLSADSTRLTIFWAMLKASRATKRSEAAGSCANGARHYLPAYFAALAARPLSGHAAGFRLGSWGFLRKYFTFPRQLGLGADDDWSDHSRGNWCPEPRRDDIELGRAAWPREIISRWKR